ncbi:hypothetical protein ICN83_05335 [Sphingopyxis granuli]|nr:hypothetical protein ICN83_05335 [Sphingopyxis granuli]
MKRAKVCRRDIKAGPGTCGYWWEGCPASVRHCFNRHIRDEGGLLEMQQAEAWAAKRDAALDPSPTLL